MRPLTLTIVLCASVCDAEPDVWLFPTLATPRSATVSGRVLREKPTEGSSVWSRNIRNLTASTWKGAPVTVGFFGKLEEEKSGQDGVYSASFEAEKEAPWIPGSYMAEVRVPGATDRGPVTVVSDAAPFLLISDFDDTIAKTNVLSKRELLRSALWRDGLTQPVVDGMPELYRCIVDKPEKPGFAIVSGSPHQFHWRMTAFLKKHDFPLGGLYLRNLGPQTLKNYKQPILRALLKEFPHPVVLVGDSGEHDPEIYAEIRGEAPERILAIFIRNVGRDADPSRFTGMTLFKEGRDLGMHALAKGLISKECHDAAFGEGK